MSAHVAYRCAILRGWSPEYAQPITPVAAISWKEGSSLSTLSIRWVPAITPSESNAEDLWRHRLFNADGDLTVEEFLTHYENGDSASILHCEVPEGAEGTGWAADLLLDQILDALASEFLDTEELSMDHLAALTASGLEE